MIRGEEELYKRFYATALQTIADARGLDAFDINGTRDLARKTAEMCVAITKEKQVAETKRNEKETRFKAQNYETG